VTSPVPWQAWAPPLDPPVDGGLPAIQAQAIADEWWDVDPHLCAALQWEAYAAMLPPSLPMSRVSTGAQSVAYDPPMPGGDSGAAMARAAWHRSFVTGELVSVPLRAPAPHRIGGAEWFWNWWTTEPAE
jgi:hypothetical protein